jgi:hypothetical protein
MYTDGLVERPDRTLDDAITDLADSVAETAAEEPDTDRPSAVLRAIRRANSDDDGCILAAQTHGRPR